MIKLTIMCFLLKFFIDSFTMPKSKERISDSEEESSAADSEASIKTFQKNILNFNRNFFFV